MARQGNQRKSGREPIESPANQQSTRPREDRIRQRAYERYRQRGGEDGRDTDAWLEAEREVEGESVPRNREQNLPLQQGDSIEAAVNTERRRDREGNTP